jgi:hypothetical protein
MDLPRPTRQSSGAFPSAPGGRSDLQAFLPPFFGMLQSSSCVLGISWRTCIFRGRFVDIPHRGGLGLKLVSAPRTTPALFDIPRTGQALHNLMRRAQSWSGALQHVQPGPAHRHRKPQSARGALLSDWTPSKPLIEMLGAEPLRSDLLLHHLQGDEKKRIAQRRLGATVRGAKPLSSLSRHHGFWLLEIQRLAAQRAI